MGIIEYLFVVIGMIGLWSFGRIFVRVDVFSSFLAGILVSGGIVAVTARFMPLYTRELVGAMVLMGIIYTGRELLYKVQVFPARLNIWLGIVFVLTAVYFRFFHFSNYVYQSHDVVYFSPAFEMLTADYWGNLKVPTYYPFEMAANHLLPSAVLASTGFIAPHPNMMLFIEIRYLLIIVFVSHFVIQLHRIIKTKNLFIYTIVTISLLMIYGDEISYNLIVSSFVYIFVLFQIIILILREEKNEKELLFFTIFLIASKAPVFYIAGAMGLYYWYHYKSKRFHPVVLTAGLITLCNLASWAIIPPPVAPGAGGFNLMNPLNMKELFSFAAIYGWSMVDNFKHVLSYLLAPIDFRGFGGNYPSLMDLLRSRWNSIAALSGVIIYILIKYYAVFWLGWKNLYSSLENRRIEMCGLLLYMGVSLLGWIFVRNDGFIDHQAHAYFFAAMVSMSFAIIIVSNAKKWFLVIPIALFFIYGQDPSRVLMQSSGEQRVSGKASYMAISDVKEQEGSNGFYIPAPGTPFWKMELEAMLLGLRLRAKDAPTLESMSWNDGKMRFWVLKPNEMNQ